ncbi:MAG: ANTAR domain-containing protein [Kibdelosporangium sp.]
MAHTESSLDVSAELSPGGILVLRVRGAIDAVNSDEFAGYLNTEVPADVAHVVVDLGELDVLSTAGVRVLIEQTKVRSLLTVVSTPYVRKILDLTSAPGDLALYDSLGAAIAACRVPPELAELRQEIFGLRAALRTRPMIARALGILQGRYGMSDVDRAFTLLRESAQRHNLKLHTLANALIAAPAPRSAEEWFPGRVRRPAPPLSFQPFDKQHNRTAVLAAFLEQVIDLMDATTGDLQLVDTPSGALRLEQHRGLPPEFVDFFAVVDDSSTPCGAALERKSRVIVKDVATDPILAGTGSGQMVLEVGIRSVQCTPLLTPDGRCIGMVSTHDSRTGRTPTASQAAQLDRGAREVAVWLDWHQRTIVLDALEYIHQRAIE